MSAVARTVLCLAALAVALVSASAASAASAWTAPREVPAGDFAYMSTWPVSGTPNAPPVFSVFGCGATGLNVCSTGLYSRASPGGAFSSQQTSIDGYVSSTSGAHLTRPFAVSPTGRLAVTYAQHADGGQAEFVARMDTDGTWLAPVRLAPGDEYSNFTEETMVGTWRPGGQTSVTLTRTQPYQAYDYLGDLRTYTSPSKLVVRDLPGDATHTLHDEAVDHEPVYITSVDNDANTAGRQAVVWSRIRWNPTAEAYFQKLYVAVREAGAPSFSPAQLVRESTEPGWRDGEVSVAVSESGDIAVSTSDQMGSFTVHTQAPGDSGWQATPGTGWLVQDSLHFRDGRPAGVTAASNGETDWVAKYLHHTGSGWSAQTIPGDNSYSSGNVFVGHSRRGDVIIGWNGYDLPGEDPWGRATHRTADAADFEPAHLLPDTLNGVAVSESGVATVVYSTCDSATGECHVWARDSGAPAPAALITSGPPADRPLPGRDHTFAFSADAGGALFECHLDTDAWTACTNPHTLTNVSDGQHTFSVRAHLPGGDPGETDSQPFTVDNTAPQTTFASGPSGDIALRTLTFEFSTSEPGSSFECSRDGAPFAACANPHTWNDVPLGPHTFTVRATDPAGNRDDSGTARVFNVVEPGGDNGTGGACTLDDAPASRAQARTITYGDQHVLCIGFIYAAGMLSKKVFHQLFIPHIRLFFGSITCHKVTPRVRFLIDALIFLRIILR